jgi:hypothetical protein
VSEPAARDLAFVLDEDGALDGSVASWVGFGARYDCELEAPPVHGTVTLDRATGAFRYVPAPDFNGTDAFTYHIRKGTTASTPGTVTLTVRAVNDPPVAQDGSDGLDEDTPLSGQLMAMDVDGDPLTFAVTEPPRHGTLTIDATTGAFRYVPRAHYVGRDAFQFVASDGQLTSAPAFVTLAVAPVNDPPVARGEQPVVHVGGIVAGALWADDVDGELVSTFAVWSGPANGTVQLPAGSRNYTYTPTAGWSGDDTFWFFASDGELVSQLTSVTVHVRDTAPAGPQIQRQVGRTTVAEGESAVLGVTAAGMPGLTFRWRRNGILVPNAASATYVTPPLSVNDSGTTYAVTAYNAPASTTSLSWVVNVVQRRGDGQQLVSLYSTRAELYPSIQPLAITSIAPLAAAVGARISFDGAAGNLPSFTTSGDAVVTAQAAIGAMDVVFLDTASGGVRTAALSVSASEASAGLPIALQFESAAALAAGGAAGPPRVTITELHVPFAYSHVDDWLVRTATTTEVAFAQEAWGAVVAAESSPTAKAQAIARAIIDAVELHRGVPSDAMTAPPFEQYRRAVNGLDHVWCSNIAQIFALACNALGIPARMLAMNRYEALGADYDLLTAEGHNTTEIFDSQLNAWVWIDATSYFLGMEQVGLGLMDTVEMQGAINDPTRLPFLTVLEYDPATSQVASRPTATAVHWSDLAHFFGADTIVAAPKRGAGLNREFRTNERELYPQRYEVALRAVRELPDGVGVSMELRSDLPDLAGFELRQTYASWGQADPTIRSSTDGRFDVAFPSPHAPVVKAMIVNVRALSASGASSPEYPVVIYLYPTEFYAASGLTRKGLIIFTRGDLPVASVDPSDWIVDEPSLEDLRFAYGTWGATLAARPAAVEKVRALAATILGAIGARRGTPAGDVAANPLGHYQRVVAGLDAVDDEGLARILVRACTASGLWARLVEMGRVLGRGAGYDLLGAEPRFSVEVFDPEGNRWVLVDPATGVLGADLVGYGALNWAQFARLLQAELVASGLVLSTFDVATHTVSSEPAGASAACSGLGGYFSTQPFLGFTRTAQ